MTQATAIDWRQYLHPNGEYVELTVEATALGEDLTTEAGAANVEVSATTDMAGVTLAFEMPGEEGDTEPAYTSVWFTAETAAEYAIQLRAAAAAPDSTEWDRTHWETWPQFQAFVSCNGETTEATVEIGVYSDFPAGSVCLDVHHAPSSTRSAVLVTSETAAAIADGIDAAVAYLQHHQAA